MKNTFTRLKQYMPTIYLLSVNSEFASKTHTIYPYYMFFLGYNRFCIRLSLTIKWFYYAYLVCVCFLFIFFKDSFLCGLRKKCGFVHIPAYTIYILRPRLFTKTRKVASFSLIVNSKLTLS